MSKREVKRETVNNGVFQSETDAASTISDEELGNMVLWNLNRLMEYEHFAQQRWNISEASEKMWGLRPTPFEVQHQTAVDVEQQPYVTPITRCSDDKDTLNRAALIQSKQGNPNKSVNDISCEKIGLGAVSQIKMAIGLYYTLLNLAHKNMLTHSEMGFL